MKRLALAFVAALLLVVSALAAQELVTLTTPQVVTASTCRLRYFALDPSLDAPAQGRIIVEVALNTGAATSVIYGPNGVTVNGVQGAATPTGATLLSALNTSNNSAGTSLIKRVYAQLGSSGVCVGTVSGSPQ